MKTDNNALLEFEKFMAIRLKSSTDFVEGHFDSLKDISVSNEPATIFPPNGIYISGVSEVNDFNQKGASNFLPGAENKFEVIHQYACDSLAYWTGIQRSTVNVKGRDSAVISISESPKSSEKSKAIGSFCIDMPINWPNNRDGLANRQIKRLCAANHWRLFKLLCIAAFT